MAKTIAFIGLGNMGGPMAANLVKAGFEVIGFDLNPVSREAAAATGIQIATSVVNAVQGAGAVVTMLPAGQHVLSVWSEIADHLRPGTLLIDSSTIDVTSARSAHGLFEGKDCDTLDAPVSGGTGGASAGTLTFMVGGSQAAFAKAEPVLRAMGKRIVHCGDAGAGQSAKICNNMILGISMAAVCEGFVLGERLGLSHKALFDVASTSSGQCWSLTSYCPVPGLIETSPANNDYKPGFSTALMLKDLRLAQQAALASGATTPLGAEATQLFSLFEKLGYGGRDFSAIIELFRGQAQQ